MSPRYDLSSLSPGSPARARAGVSPATLRRWLLLGAGAALLLAAGWIYWVWSAPYRAVNQFLAAVERGDAAAVYRLSYPDERAKTNLTRAAVSQALADAFPSPVRRDPKRRHADTRWYDRYGGREYNYMCYWVDAATGRPLPGVWGRPPQLFGTVVVRETREGWRVNVGLFLLSIYAGRYGPPQHFRPYRRMARRTGLKGVIDFDLEWKP